mmetsp:Transcript_88523/g.229696  ORF Transcript_88523/g.229696 Transcript_88523/m.229696 type:complete len:270 (+) Transcript_88523:1078-1887(+)
MVELRERVLRIQHLVGHLLRQRPVRLHVLHARPQQAARRLLVLFLRHRGLHASQDLRRRRRQRHAADQPRLVRGLLVGGHGHNLRSRDAGLRGITVRRAGPSPDVKLRADGQAVVVLLAVEVEVALGRGELLPLRQADDLDARVLRVSDPEGHLVDAVKCVQARVAVTLHVVLGGVSVALRVLHEVLRLPRQGQTEPLLERLLAPDLPILGVRAVLRVELLAALLELRVGGVRPDELAERDLLTLHGLPVVHELHAREEGVVHTKDLGN